MRGGEVPRGREGAEVDLLGELGHDAVLYHLHHLLGAPGELLLLESYSKVREDFTITEKATTRAFSWLKAPISTFTFKALLRH